MEDDIVTLNLPPRGLVAASAHLNGAPLKRMLCGPWPSAAGLIAGLEFHQGGFYIAFVDAEAAHYPWSDDLHHFKSLSSFERYWNRRFHHHEESDYNNVTLAVRVVDHPGLMLWLETQGVTVRVLQGVDMFPFIHEAQNYEIPQKYHQAHALAQCVATQVRARQDLYNVATTLNELHFHFRQAEHTLRRLSAACNHYPT